MLEPYPEYTAATESAVGGGFGVLRRGSAARGLVLAAAAIRGSGAGEGQAQQI